VSEATVKLIETEAQIEVQIYDEGNGFSHELNKKGVGLFSMDERARGIGGSLKIASKPGQGTRIVLTAPKNQLN
jgi:two-component system sensor histidine kinase NreB